MNRRKFLRGIAGAAVGLPILEGLRRVSRARGGGDVQPVYSFFMRQGNGVQQIDTSRGEPERFWPRNLGQITTESLSTTDGDRALSVLADHASKLQLVRGTRFAFSTNSCGHAGGLNQCLTAARINGNDNTSLANGESIDWFIANRVNPEGVDPFTLMSGPQSAYIAHGLSYSGPNQLRGAQNNPFAAYTSLVGLGGAPLELLEQIAARRKSVNDLVRDQMVTLRGMSSLSGADRQRLDTHFDAIRDLEVGMGCVLAENEVDAIEAISQASEANGNRVAIAKFMLDLAALAFACDANRVGTLQVGSGNDGTRYTIDGVLQNTYHRISHRIDDDGSSGPPIPNADLLHHEIDKIHADIFKHFLDRLASYPGPSGGTLLDDTVALWTNDLANGPPHSYTNLPQVIGGGAGGFLRTGVYIDAGNVTHNRFLNTIINAVGIRQDSGDYYDSFGDSALPAGVISGMIA
jgi:hypothetical protein